MKSFVIRLFLLISFLYIQEAFASSACPSGWIKYTIGTSQCLKKVGKNDISKALILCQQNNATLPLPKNDVEDNQLTNFMKKHSLYGMALDGSDKDKEGHWVDSHDKPIGYTNWDKGQPDNKISYVFFTLPQNFLSKKSNGKWDDSEKTHKTHIICVKPPKMMKTTTPKTTTAGVSTSITQLTTGTSQFHY